MRCSNVVKLLKVNYNRARRLADLGRAIFSDPELADLMPRFSLSVSSCPRLALPPPALAMAAAGTCTDHTASQFYRFYPSTFEAGFTLPPLQVLKEGLRGLVQPVCGQVVISQELIVRALPFQSYFPVYSPPRALIYNQRGALGD